MQMVVNPKLLSVGAGPEGLVATGILVRKFARIRWVSKIVNNWLHGCNS